MHRKLTSNKLRAVFYCRLSLRERALFRGAKGDTYTFSLLDDTVAIDRGIAAYVQAAEPFARMAPYQRQDVLNHCVKCFTEWFEELAMSLSCLTGNELS